MLPRFARIQEAVEDLEVPHRTVNQAVAVSWALLVPPDGRKRSLSSLSRITGYAEVTVARILNNLKRLRGFKYSTQGAWVTEPHAWLWEETVQDSDEKAADTRAAKKIFLDAQRRRGIASLNDDSLPPAEGFPEMERLLAFEHPPMNAVTHEEVDVNDMLDTNEGTLGVNGDLTHDEWEALPVIMSPRRPPSPPTLAGNTVALLRSSKSEREPNMEPLATVHESFQQLLTTGRSVREDLVLIGHLNERNNIPHTTPNIYTDMQQQRLDERLDDFISSFSNATGYTPPTIRSCCPICQTCVTKPVCLDCGHLVCHSCVTSPYLNNFDGRVKCPMCKSMGQWRRVYPS